MADALPAARRAYKCFEPYGENVREYARATAWQGCRSAELERAHRERPGATEPTEAVHDSHFFREVQRLMDERGIESLE